MSPVVTKESTNCKSGINGVGAKRKPGVDALGAKQWFISLSHSLKGPFGMGVGVVVISCCPCRY